MKIRSDHLRALQENQDQKQKTRKAAEDFDRLFSRELSANPAPGNEPGAAISSSPGGAPAGPFGIQNPALLELQASLAPGGLQETGPGAPQGAAEAMESMLSTLDSYAQQLALDRKADMKGAYALLESVSRQISQWKEQYPDMEREQPGLAALIDELDVLAATETYKFNRGDYL